MMSSLHAQRPRLLAFALTLATASTGLAMGSAGAQAQGGGCQGPPGASAVEQYCEAIPRADGGRTKASGDGSGKNLSERTNSQLGQAGDDGAAVKKLTDDGSTAPSGSGGSGSDSGSGSGSGSGSDSDGGSGAGAVSGTTPTGVDAPVDASGSPLKAATNAVESGSTAGPALAWGVVGMSAFGAAAALLLRRRAHAIPPASDDENESGSAG